MSDRYAHELKVSKSNMDTFCIKPTAERYLNVCNNKKLQNECGTDFDIWKKAVQYYHPNIAGYLSEEEKAAFIFCENKLYAAFLETPNLNKSRKIWRLYCASGDKKYVILQLQVLSSKIGASFKQQMLNMYNEFRDLFSMAVLHEKKINPDFDGSPFDFSKIEREY